MRHVILSSVASPDLQYFSTLSHKRHHFRKRKTLLKMEYVFWFSQKILSETFLILRRTERGIIINVHRSSRKIPVILVGVEWILNFLNRFSKNTQISKSMKIRPVGAELFHVDRKTYIQTDMMKLSVTFAILRRHLKILHGANITLMRCICISERTATLSLHTLRGFFLVQDIPLCLKYNNKK